MSPVSQLTPEPESRDRQDDPLSYGFDRTYDPYEPPEWGPVKPEPRFRILRKLAAPFVFLGLLLWKFKFILAAIFKFKIVTTSASMLISLAAYAWFWGWRFAAGFILLLLVHELGHYLEARRQGLHPALPVFIPFLGAYVAIKDAPFDPWRNGLVSIAGPIAGGLASLATLAAGEQLDSRLLLALAYSGFFLNLFNLIPIGFLDGGFILRSFRLLRRGAGDADPARARRRAWTLGAMSAAVAVALIVGMFAAHVPQDRL
jgi:Zn-dependent protease